MRTALSIAGSDPSGGAGLQLDLKVFRSFGVYGISVVSALTAQNTVEVSAVQAVEVGLIESQLRTILNDIRPAALKTGMLFSAEAVRAVAQAVKGFELQNLVVDPVTVSSTGRELIEGEALQSLKDDLIPLARVITPNIYEASLLSGIAIIDEASMEAAARSLVSNGAQNVVITGGHYNALFRQTTRDITVELIFDGKKIHRVTGTRIKGEYHGTGCAFSAAITALLAKGASVTRAVQRARAFMAEAIRKADRLGKGMRLLHV